MRHAAAIIAIIAGVLVSTGPAGAAIIEEISVDSIDTSYTVATGELRFEQWGVTVVREWSDGGQDSVAGAHFLMVTTLTSDNSGSGRAVGAFGGGGIVIDDGAGATYLAADITTMFVEEAVVLPGCVLAGEASFTVAADPQIGGIWQSELNWFGGQAFALTWVMSKELDDFSSEDFFGAADESDLTLIGEEIPEPASVGLLLLGGLASLGRRRRKQ